MKSTKTKTLKTALADVYLLENGILYVDYRDCVQDDVKIVEQHIEAIKKTFGADLYVLVDSTKVKYVSREVRNFSATPKVIGTTIASAIIVGNGISRIGGSLYLNFNKPPIPIKLFANFEKAEAWLLEKRAKDSIIK